MPLKRTTSMKNINGFIVTKALQACNRPVLFSELLKIMAKVTEKPSKKIRGSLMKVLNGGLSYGEFSCKDSRYSLPGQESKMETDQNEILQVDPEAISYLKRIDTEFHVYSPTTLEQEDFYKPMQKPLEGQRVNIHLNGHILAGLISACNRPPTYNELLKIMVEITGKPRKMLRASLWNALDGAVEFQFFKRKNYRYSVTGIHDSFNMKFDRKEPLIVDPVVMYKLKQLGPPFLVDEKAVRSKASVKYKPLKGKTGYDAAPKRRRKLR